MLMHRYGPPHPWMHRHPHPWGGGFGWGPGPDPSTALSALNTVLWIVLFIGIAWMLLWWIFPYVKPIIAGFFGGTPVGLSPLDRLRQRYAAGEIDGETFVQMRERLVASYEPKDIRPGEEDRKSTRLNSSHLVISYAVFCLKKKNEFFARNCAKHFPAINLRLVRSTYCSPGHQPALWR